MAEGFNPILNNRGRYKCPYCNHKTYKSAAGARSHIANNHKLEAEASEAKNRLKAAERTIEFERAEKSRLREQLAEARKPKPEPKKEGYNATVYCPNCLTVDSVLIPSGGSPEASGCFRCHRTPTYWVKSINTNRIY